MLHRNKQEKSSPFLPQVLMLDENPSKENIQKIARECIVMDGVSREGALMLIGALHEAEARDSRGVGQKIEQLIATAEENLRLQMRMAG